MVLQLAILDYQTSEINLSKEKQQKFPEIAQWLSERYHEFIDTVLNATMVWSRQFESALQLAM